MTDKSLLYPQRCQLAIDDSGLQLSYIDSGVPPKSALYTTVFMAHGTMFSSRALLNYLGMLVY